MNITELGFVVNTLKQPRVLDPNSMNGRPSSGERLHNIGEVFLTLSVMGAKPCQRTAHSIALEHIRSGINFGKRCFLGSRIALFHHPLHETLVIADNPAIPGGVLQHRGDEGGTRPLIAMVGDDGTQGV